MRKSLAVWLVSLVVLAGGWNAAGLKVQHVSAGERLSDAERTKLQEATAKRKQREAQVRITAKLVDKAVKDIESAKTTRQQIMAVERTKEALGLGRDRSQGKFNLIEETITNEDRNRLCDLLIPLAKVPNDDLCYQAIEIACAIGFELRMISTERVLDLVKNGGSKRTRERAAMASRMRKQPKAKTPGPTEEQKLAEKKRLDAEREAQEIKEFFAREDVKEFVKKNSKKIAINLKLGPTRGGVSEKFKKMNEKERIEALMVDMNAMYNDYQPAGD